jgi:uncharacterized membrane protein
LPIRVPRCAQVRGGMELLVRRRVLWDYLVGALWVFPTVLVVGFLTAGALLSGVSVDADSLLWPLALQGTAEDARGILVVMSATMITVTGLVFALTIVALQIASGRYSPRLLRNFMCDRGHPGRAGRLCGRLRLLDSRAAHGRDPACRRGGVHAPPGRVRIAGARPGQCRGADLLPPHLARSIQIDAIMGQVERETRWVIDDLYPNGSGYLEPEQRCPDPPASAAVLPAGRSGYLQAVQPEPLIRAAARQDLVVRLARQVGDHVVAGTPLAFAWRRGPRPAGG